MYAEQIHHANGFFLYSLAILAVSAVIFHACFYKQLINNSKTIDKITFEEDNKNIFTNNQQSLESSEKYEITKYSIFNKSPVRIFLTVANIVYSTSFLAIKLIETLLSKFFFKLIF
jgi:hypothetical protein